MGGRNPRVEVNIGPTDHENAFHRTTIGELEPQSGYLGAVNDESVPPSSVASRAKKSSMERSHGAALKQDFGVEASDRVKPKWLRQVVIGAAFAAAGVFAVLPSMVGVPTSSISTTHLMDAVTSGPLGAILLLGLPLLIVGVLVTTEFWILLRSKPSDKVRQLSEWTGLLGGPIMLGVFVHLFVRIGIPITLKPGWRGPGDVLSMALYSVLIAFLLAVALVEAGVLGRTRRSARRLHAMLLAGCLLIVPFMLVLTVLHPAYFGWGQIPTVGQVLGTGKK